MTNTGPLFIKQSKTRFLRLIIGKMVISLFYGFLIPLSISDILVDSSLYANIRIILTVLIFLGFLTWQSHQNISNWFWELQVAPDNSQFQTLRKNTILIAQQDVTSYEIYKGTLLINRTLSQQLKLNLRSLPLKDVVILIHTISNWVPRSILPPQPQTALLHREQNHEEVYSLRQLSHTAQRNHKARWIIRGLSLLIGLGFISLLIWLRLKSLAEIQWGIEMVIITLLFVGLPLIIIFSVWTVSVNAKISVNDEGIVLESRNTRNKFRWESIEAIFIHFSTQHQIVDIWQQGSKASKLNLYYLHKTDKTALADIIRKQAFARNIPFNFV